MNNQGNGSPVRLNGSGSGLPVFKIDMHGNVLQNNDHATNLLAEWGCMVNDRLPDHVLGAYPEMLKAWTCSEIEVEFSDRKIGFTVVPFLEAGYIGIYAHRVLELLPVAKKVHKHVNR